MSPETFSNHLQKLVDLHGSVGRALCAMLDVPYLEDRETERLLGHRRIREKVPSNNSESLVANKEDRLEGPLLPTREFLLVDRGEPQGILRTNEWNKVPYDAKQLTDEVWSKDNWPDSYNSIVGAVAKLQGGVTGGYFHKASLNLVFLSIMGEKVGIRRTEFTIPTRSMLTERLAPLMALRKAATS